MTPRLLATDLDGTLLRPDGEVSARTVAALARAQAAGVEVVFVTARPHRWLTPLAAVVHEHGTAICTNGASVVEVATQTVLVEHGMSVETVVEIAARLRSDLGPAIRLATESAAGLVYEHGFMPSRPAEPGDPSVDRIERALPAATLKLLVHTEEIWAARRPEEFTARVAACTDGLATATSSGVDALGEIAALGVTKARTLADWAAARGIDPDDVWAVGDAPNDLPMLAWASRSFAVANAHHTVLATVDEVLPPNTDDGVATLLERLAAPSR
ncbi:MAG: HAD family hydrolase [Micrococcales bacterium]|nr:HAD family hydrolase [Micrococcales bacterium]